MDERTILFLCGYTYADSATDASTAVRNIRQCGFQNILLAHELWNYCPHLTEGILAIPNRLVGAHIQPGAWAAGSTVASEVARLQKIVHPRFVYCDGAELFAVPGDAEASKLKVREYVQAFRDLAFSNYRYALVGSSDYGNVFDLINLVHSADQDRSADPLEWARRRAAMANGGKTSNAWFGQRRVELGWWGECDNLELYAPEVYQQVWTLARDGNLGLTYRTGVPMFLGTDERHLDHFRLLAALETVNALVPSLEVRP